MLKIFNSIGAIFSPSKEGSSILKETTEFADRMFTSDEDRKKYAVLMEKVALSSRSTFVQSGRSALMWAMAIIAVYQFVVRDALAICFGVSLPPIDFDAELLLKNLLSLLAGTL